MQKSLIDNRNTLLSMGDFAFYYATTKNNLIPGIKTKRIYGENRAFYMPML